MTVQINGTSGLVFNDNSSQNTAASGFGFKNRLINSAMMIDQRNAGASLTVTTSTAYCLDRWRSYATQSSKYSVQQNAGSVTPPEGFTNYLGVTSLSAYSIGVNDTFAIAQYIEGFNTADFGWGTANAKTVTLSFWVRSSLTGTFGGSLVNNGWTRSYPFTYTISSANTWEKKTITIAGDTTGTWTTDNTAGVKLFFSLGIGSTYSGTAGAWAGAEYESATGATSVVGTNGATFYITGVQLEKGSTATSFDYRPYGTELELAKRYYQEQGQVLASFQSPGVNTSRTINYSLTPEMRTAPTVTVAANGEFTSIATTNRLGNTHKLVCIEGTVGNIGNYGFVDRITFNAEL